MSKRNSLLRAALESHLPPVTEVVPSVVVTEENADQVVEESGPVIDAAVADIDQTVGSLESAQLLTAGLCQFQNLINESIGDMPITAGVAGALSYGIEQLYSEHDIPGLEAAGDLPEDADAPAADDDAPAPGGGPDADPAPAPGADTADASADAAAEPAADAAVEPAADAATEPAADAAAAQPADNFDQAQADKLKADLQNAGTGTQAASTLTGRIKAAWDKVVQFFRDLWKKLVALFHRLFGSTNAIRQQIKNLSEKVNQADLSGETTVDGWNIAENVHAAKIYNTLYSGQDLTGDVIPFVDALHTQQRAINQADEAFSKDYAEQSERLREALKSSDANKVIELANAEIKMPYGYREVRADNPGERKWAPSTALPGNQALYLIQKSSAAGGYSLRIYDVRLAPFNTDSSAIPTDAKLPVMSANSLRQLGNHVTKILDDVKNGGKAIEHAKQITEKNTMGVRLAPSALAMTNLFMQRYRAVGRLSTKINALMVKSVGSIVKWAEMSLEAYPGR